VEAVAAVQQELKAATTSKEEVLVMPAAQTVGSIVSRYAGEIALPCSDR